MYVCRGEVLPRNSSWPPRPPWDVQDFSLTTRWEGASGPTGKGLGPPRPSSPSELQSLVITCASDRQALNRSFPRPHLRFSQFARIAHKTQETCLLAKVPMYYKGCDPGGRGRNTWDEFPGGSVSRAGGVWKPSGSPAWELAEPPPCGLLGRLHCVGGTDPWPRSPPRKSRGGTEVPASCPWLVSPSTSPGP